MQTRQPERLIVVLGDQLNRDSAALQALNPQRDVVWMAEAREEATHVWSHKARIALFLAAMRHFRDQLRKRGLTVEYHALDEDRETSLASLLAQDLGRLRAGSVRMVQAGDHRVQTALERAVARAGAALARVPDRHFLCSLEDFDAWAEGRKQLRLEHFYRHLRQRTGVLMDGDAPVGGRWNFDADNRGRFGRQGPASLRAPKSFRPDAITRDVLGLVERRFAQHPGSLDAFDWPVTRRQALLALGDFIEHRLPMFGRYQDAMWDSEPWLYHSRLSAALNLKLLAPAEVIAAAEQALTDGHAPVNAVEGFIRQILGWREFVRGLYWRDMPEYAGRNELNAQLPLPDFYWTADTDMACLRSVVGQTLQYGYAHHIQRLMVTGLFALLLGVEPKRVHEWYLAVYVDAVEWVELPNTIGMSQYADGGVMASKPYVASGRYISRMSNYCGTCRYDPAQATGDTACPFTTLYWDFLMRHRDRFANHPRTGYQWRNLTRLSTPQRRAIRQQATRLRERLVAANAKT